MLQPTQQQNVTWPITADAADLRVIVSDQAATMAANAVLLDSYQHALSAAQNPPPGTATTAVGTSTGSSLALSNVAGPPIQNGSVITNGALVPADTTILGQISGTTGGNGTYLTSGPTTLTDTPITITPPAATGTWPVANDSATLMLIMQDQLTILRQQAALLQAYQDLLNVSDTPIPNG